VKIQSKVLLLKSQAFQAIPGTLKNNSKLEGLEYSRNFKKKKLQILIHTIILIHKKKKHESKVLAQLNSLFPLLHKLN